MRVWILHVNNYDQVMVELKKICGANQIHIEDIPQFVIHLMKTKIPYGLSPHSLNGGLRSNYDYTSDKTVNLELEQFAPPFIMKHLYQFQKDGIRKGIRLHGRILVNDDYGTGKSLQALTLALAYKTEWPLIIICPQIFKYQWRYEILKWLPGIDRDKIILVKHDREKF